MYTSIDPSGCYEIGGLVQTRLGMFLERDDARYNDAAEGPFHTHFVHFEPDVTLEQIQSVAAFHLPNFYAAWLQEYDKVPGGMRHGWDINTRQPAIRYDQTDPELYAIRKPLCLEKVRLIKELSLSIKSKNIGRTFPATIIDVGPGAESRATQSAYDYTKIDLEKAANASGNLDTFELWYYSDGVNVKVGAFSGAGVLYTNRSEVIIGSVVSGAKRTFTGLTCAVVIGDKVGEYRTGGYLWVDTLGGSGTTEDAGDQFGTGEQTVIIKAGHQISIYATGETPVATTDSKCALMGAKMIAGKMI